MDNIGNISISRRTVNRDIGPMPKKSDSCSGGPLQRGAPCHGIIGIMVNPPLPAVSRVRLLTGKFTGESLHSGAGGAVRDRRADRVRHDGERRVDHRTQALP